MEPIPNWFRWLIIVIATLIMCACRAPIQNRATRSVLKKHATDPVNVYGYDRSLLSKLTASQESYQLEDRFAGSQRETQPLSIQRTELPTPQAAPGIEEPCVAPIVYRNGERISVVDTAARTKQGTHKAPIYFHVNNDSLVSNEASIRQTQAVEGSPFLDDPELPPASESPLAPIVDPSFLDPGPEIPVQQGVIQQDPIQQGPIQQGVVIESNPIPMMGEEIVAPLAPEHIDSGTPLPAPFDYLPQAEIPIDVSPEEWATSPVETMKTSYADLARHYPDEYICDGGDANGRVKVGRDWSLHHLDPEDTIGHFDTLDWEVGVEASNRVCIYAPRFAAVRKVTSPFQNEKREQVLIEKQDKLAVIEQKRQSSDQYSQNLAPRRHLALQPASSVQLDLPGVEGVHTLPVRIMDHDLSVHEDFRVMKIGIHKQSDKPRLAEFAAKAITWSHDVGVQVVVDEVVARTAMSRKGAESIHTIGDNRPAKLRVIKTASVSDALPGEEIEFTLRFDNVGHQPMGNVTIIDNLTTRLEYLDETQLCSVEAVFVEDENEVDSLTLRWEIVEPIMPGKGGLIRFRCRLR